MASEAEPSAEPQHRRHSWPQHPSPQSATTTTTPVAPLSSPRPRPFQILAKTVWFITSCGLLSVLIAIVLRYLAQPSAVPLAIHWPVAQLPSTLRSFTPPPTSYGHPSSYFAELDSLYEYGVQDLCDCPLKWIRERRRYSPDADGLYDYDMWVDAPKNAPGKLYPWDETEMEKLGLACDAALNQAKALREMSRDTMVKLQQAHKDSVATVYSIAAHLGRIHRRQRERNKTSSKDDDVVLSKYLAELNAVTYTEWVEQVNVPDPSLPTSGQYQRKNRRAFVTEEMVISRGHLRLHSLEMLASQLSNLSDLALSLNSQVTTSEARIKPLIVDPKSKKQKCLTGWLKSLPSLHEGDDASRLATEQARSLRQSISQIDALRLSLGGFLRGGDEHKGYDTPAVGPIRRLSLLRNDTTLQGDHWQATWRWMGLDTEEVWALSPSSSTGALMAWLRRWLPRHPIRLPSLETQYMALLEAFRRAEKEAERSWIPFCYPPLTNLRGSGR